MCLCVCLCVCLCLNYVLIAAPIDLIFGMHTHSIYRSAIGYIFLTFEVIKGLYRYFLFLGYGSNGVQELQGWKCEVVSRCYMFDLK